MKNPFLERAFSFENSGDAQDSLNNLVGIHGVTNATYLGVDIPTLGIDRDYVVTTYAKDWAAHYYQEKYQGIDPIINKSMMGIVPYDWDDRQKGSVKIENFFGEAKEFGVGRKGMSIPVRGISGETALFSINADMSDREWVNFRHENTSHLMMAAYYFHIAIMNLEIKGQASSPFSLSPREREVMQWASRGKTIWETAKILNISESAVNLYLRNSQVALRAVNKVQAVAIALGYHLLD